ncbi:MAG TPA: hypothetical protein VM871_05215, partial [Flavisolibacter sp.]|nr:hypothetical protein [Flavisolibacter sp.]
EFYQYYFQRYKDVIKTQFRFWSYDDFEPGLRARLYRTQFGFLTEYHAFHLCRNYFSPENVVRSVDLDRAGVDFQIRYNGALYNVHIFVDTPRAWEFRKYKSAYKNVNSLPGIHLNLPYSLQGERFNSLRYLKNGFGVYTVSYLQFLQREVDAGHIKNNNVAGTTANGFVYSA